MLTDIQADDYDLPSIDDTINAVSILGRILDEMRVRLAASERVVARLQREKLALRAELRAIADLTVSRTASAQALLGDHEVRSSPLDDEMMAIIDASFGQRAA